PFPGPDLTPDHGRFIDPPIQTLPIHDPELDLGHVQPTPVLGGRVNLQPIQQPSRLAGRERLIQTDTAVRVQVIHHQTDLLGLRIVDVHQLLDAFGPIAAGAPLRHPHVPPAPQWLAHHEQVARPLALVLVIDAGGAPRLRGHRDRDLTDELLARLVQTDYRMSGVVRDLVDLKHVLTTQGWTSFFLAPGAPPRARRPGHIRERLTDRPRARGSSSNGLAEG